MEKRNRMLLRKSGGSGNAPGAGPIPVVALLGGASLVFLVGALVQDGVEAAFLGVAALVLGLAFLLAATRGTRAHGVARVAAAVAGAGVIMGALGLAAGSIWMILIQGGLGVLLGVVGLPAAFVMGLLGRLLIEMARSGLEPRNTTGGRGSSPLPPAPPTRPPGRTAPGG